MVETLAGRKYGFTGEVLEYRGHTLRRIIATEAITNSYGNILVDKGSIGGWIENKSNLIQSGWVSGSAKVYDGAMVYGEALVFDNAEAFGRSVIKDMARLSGNAQAYDSATIVGYASVTGNAQVYDQAVILGDSLVRDNSIIRGRTLISHRSTIDGDSVIDFNGTIHGISVKNALIHTQLDFLSGKITTNTTLSYVLFYTESGWQIKMGCWEGTLDEFINLIKKPKWVESDELTVLEARDEMEALIELFKARIKRVEKKSH